MDEVSPLIACLGEGWECRTIPKGGSIMGEELPWDVCEPLRPLLNIYYIRHSFRLEKDGKAIDALSEQGKDFAAFQGTKPPAAFTLGVSSTLNRAIQTLEMHALGYRANPFNPKPYRILPPLDLLGSKEIAEMISTPEVKALAATGIPKFKAILNVHG
ncbi:MAG TPA: hypothetical protein VEA18_00125, partial [Candidatus Kapabacteria bacterium]|nr:hypothetical protein [Candidatus Kapabacteria bacterium]